MEKALTLLKEISHASQPLPSYVVVDIATNRKWWIEKCGFSLEVWLTVVYGMYHSEVRVCFYVGLQSWRRVWGLLGDNPLVFISIILLLLIIYSSLLFSYLNTRSDYSHFLLGDLFKILSFLSCSIMEEHRCLSVLLHFQALWGLYFLDECHLL